MYEIFAKLMADRGLTSYRVAMDTGVSQATLSDWKRDRSTPKLPKLQKLADYFGVSIEYLMGTAMHSEGVSTAPPTDEELKFALFGDRQIDDEILEEVKALARFTQERRRAKK